MHQNLFSVRVCPRLYWVAWGTTLPHFFLSSMPSCLDLAAFAPRFLTPDLPRIDLCAPQRLVFIAYTTYIYIIVHLTCQVNLYQYQADL